MSDEIVTMHDTIEAELMSQARHYSRRIEVNPYTALLREVEWRAGHVDSIRRALASHHEDELFVTSAFGNVDDSPLLKRYDKERRFLDKACQLAIQAGVSERYVRLAELHGQLIFEVLQSALNAPEVGLSIEQREALVGAMERALNESISLDVVEENLEKLS